MLQPTFVDATIVARDRDHCVAIWHQTIIHIWRGAPTVTAVAGMVEACKNLLASGKGDVTCLAIVERSSPAPEEAARSALAKWSRDIVPQMAIAALVAEGSGFRSALVRGVGVTLTALVPHKVPFKFFSNVAEAVQQLAPALPTVSGGAIALRSVVEKLRAELDELVMKR